MERDLRTGDLDLRAGDLRRGDLERSLLRGDLDLRRSGEALRGDGDTLLARQDDERMGDRRLYGERRTGDRRAGERRRDPWNGDLLGDRPPLRGDLELLLDLELLRVDVDLDLSFLFLSSAGDFFLGDGECDFGLPFFFSSGDLVREATGFLGGDFFSGDDLLLALLEPLELLESLSLLLLRDLGFGSPFLLASSFFFSSIPALSFALTPSIL